MYEKQQGTERAEQVCTEQDHEQGPEQVGRKILGRQVLLQGDQGRAGVKKRPMRSPYDVNGSYTGTPADGGAPVQDADDL